ncbi:hypothetical protein NKI61_31360 [Mesorhizobium sp. M0514]|uniref:hypothetical protein n=1 Tax=Mesorhizobium sp. M0514 TaxID=2956955 RepID=UPI003335637D
MEAGDAIAGISLAISIWAALYSTRVERRIQTKAEHVSAFDSWIVLPLEGHLSVLSLSLTNLCSAARMNMSNVAERQIAVRNVQNSEFLGAVEEIQGFCQSRSDDAVKSIEANLNNLVDNIFDAVNSIDDDKPPAEILSLTREITLAKQSFLSQVRADVQSARLAQK